MSPLSRLAEWLSNCHPVVADGRQSLRVAALDARFENFSECRRYSRSSRFRAICFLSRLIFDIKHLAVRNLSGKP
jgi:hypothetical protein